MKKIQIFKHTELLTDKTFEADRFLGRLKGLIGVKQLSQGEGLFIPHCNSVHMWGMSVRIDLLFLKKLNRNGLYKITSIVPGVKPWKVVPLWDLNSTDVLEMSEGFIKSKGLRVGDEINVSIEGAFRTKSE